MDNAHVENGTRICFRDRCIQVGAWSLLVVGFLVVCRAVPMLALSI